MRVRALVLTALLFPILITVPTANAALYSLTSHTFTPCGATGVNGPTLANCLAQGSYSSQSWTSNASFFNVNSGIQSWTVPVTGSYRMTVAGAQGGNAGANVGGKGVIETSTVTLSEGSIIKILVGQRGASSDGSHGSGGGGTFVVQSPYNTNASIIMIAGGGGGYGISGGGANMQGQTANNPTSSQGNAGSNGGGGASAANASGGGNGFVAGAAATSSTWAAGGAGFGGNGGAYATGSIAGPKSFINGGTGGPGTPAAGAGGFGGGGGAGDRGAGGGGYSGGGGGNSNSVGGDGGGSYITGINQSAIGGANSGDGYVTITLLVAAVSNFNSFAMSGDVSTASYRTSININANLDIASKVTFLANGKRIPGCINVRTTGSTPNIIATCNWKPNRRGVINVTATAVPISGGDIGTTQTVLRITVAPRTGTR